VITLDEVRDFDEIKRTYRPILLNNNGIHPGQTEGIDACMALVRNLCVSAELRESLSNLVFLFIPIYNVDGCINRNASSRVNQVGPEMYGFRGNALHLDLNRDFIKCDNLGWFCRIKRFFSS
jgi:murein tripeptide amidase MpaA